MSLDLEQDIKGMLPEKDFDRRDFIWTALGASAALALASPASGQLITTDTAGLDAADISIPTGNRRHPRLSRDAAKGRAVPGRAGRAGDFRAQSLHEGLCRRLAKAGYYAIVPDLYTRKADLTKIKDMAEIGPIVNTQARHRACLRLRCDSRVRARRAARATSRGWGSPGFCRGGRTTLVYAAANPKLKAAVAWYGSPAGQPNEYTPRTAMDRVAEFKVPLLGLYGGRTRASRSTQVEKFFAALKASGTPAELVVYPEAGHGFHADFRPDNYRKADAEDGWNRMLAWFQKYGVA